MRHIPEDSPPHLVANLGRQAANEPSDLPSGAFTLLPEHWPANWSSSSFSHGNIKAGLGCQEHVARSLLIKEFSPQRIQEHDVDQAAVRQAFHCRKETQEKSYKYGLKNTVNVLQAKILGW